MLFGSSYKKWWVQLQEYCLINKLDRPNITVSSSDWVSFGGLKWCRLIDFQEELDKEEGNRRVTDFKFTEPNNLDLHRLFKIGVKK